MPNLTESKTSLRDYALIIAGMAIYAIGFTVFILPHEIIVGGMAGFSSLVFFGTGGHIPVAFTMYFTNILMLVIWYKVLGRQFVMRTVFGTTVLSLMIGLIEGYFTSRPPLVTDMTLSVVMGSALCGIGIGVYYSHKGSAGGTDIIAAVVERRWDFSVGRTMALVDVTIVACAFLLPFDGDLDARIQARVQTILYGWISIVIYSLIADYIVGIDKRTLQFLILSDKWEAIADHITHESGRGVTIIPATGYWTGEKRAMLIVWCRRYNADQIYGIIRSIDPGAYAILSDARSVHGNGFASLAGRKAP